MGRKKKFIDKKKSATFQLMARDTSDPNYSPDPSGDRVFVRVDDNDYAPESFDEGGPDGDPLTSNPDSIFADAPEDSDDEYVAKNFGGVQNCKTQTNGLPDHVRKEILELGFPDDGYNYLAHLREIKNTGGGSTYYQNPKADFVQLPRDVKAYDASRVEISKISDVSEEKSIYNVASKTFGVRLQKVVDPEVAAMLEDGASSKYASDVEDLEEDFVVCANLLDGPAAEENDEKLIFAAGSNSDHVKTRDLGTSSAKEEQGSVSALDSDKPRVRRPLDEHFDLLELQEYGDDNEEEEEYDGYMDDEDNNQEILTEKLNSAFKDCPSGLLRLGGAVEENEPPEPTPEVIQRCREYAEKYENDDNDLEEVLVEESSDESESAVKLERREARLMKKEMKGLYKSEAHRAQKVAAFTGPSSIHLM
ncbi:Unknown protein [Striga hermonthica]|uniref:Protein LTV1 homolog n=1 Tax=Striga hermonthica TaxID=68872 RepID=A0A9N7RTF5_STRHE|nr:Unknown protein [Striga hermonthica]